MSQPSQADIFAALAAQASGTFGSRQTPTSPYAEFAEPKEMLTTQPSVLDAVVELAKGQAQTQEQEQGKRTNSRRIYCARQGCGSVILSEGVGEWVELEGPALPHDPSSPFPVSSPLSTGGVGHWSVPSSPFAFDNIGFSRPDHTTPNPLPPFVPADDSLAPSAERKVKWLICAECDLGPVGWSYEGGKNAWVAADRVRYGEVKK